MASVTQGVTYTRRAATHSFYECLKQPSEAICLLILEETAAKLNRLAMFTDSSKIDFIFSGKDMDSSKIWICLGDAIRPGTGEGEGGWPVGSGGMVRVGVGQTVFKLFQNSLNRLKQTLNCSNFNWFKIDLSLLKNFQIKYCFEGFEERSDFLHRSFSIF
jgi:hypothetical protein